MLLYKVETVRTPVYVPVQYPAYYQGYAYASHYAAVLSDKLAVLVCVASPNVQVQGGTPAEVFRLLPFEDCVPVEETVFREALQQVQAQVAALLAR